MKEKLIQSEAKLNVSLNSNTPPLTYLLELKRKTPHITPTHLRKCLNSSFGTKYTLGDIKRLLFATFWEDESNVAEGQGVSNQPDLTIIVPVHGTEKYLEECIESLTMQTALNLEIVLVDDHSPDRSNDIILRHLLSDSRIKLVRTLGNCGLLRARQVGVQFATGRYITHVDSDDYVTPDIYEKCIDRADTTAADIVHFAMKKLVDGKLEGHLLSEPKYDLLENEQIFSAFLNGKINFSVCNKLYRRDFWFSVNHKFPRKSLMVEDLSQNLHLMHQAKVYASIAVVGYYYRITSHSDSRCSSLDRVAYRAFSAARHIAKIKVELSKAGELDRYLPLLSEFEKKIYFDYVRQLIHRYNKTKSKVQQDTIFKWLQKILRINGFLPMRNYITFDTELMQKLTYKIMSHSTAPPSISIVVPVYNTCEYLDKCLKSIANQTTKDIEVIVVDDASTDGSSAIIDRWCERDRRFRRVNHSVNKGLLQARLTGVREARGDYIGHVDSDDWIEDKMFASLLKLARSSGADIVQCGYKSVGLGQNRTTLAREIGVRYHTDIFFDFLHFQGISNTMWNKLYKRSLWAVAMPYFPNITYKAEDFCLNTFLLIMSSSLQHVSEPLYYYRIRKASGDRNQSARDIGFRVVSACYNMQRLRYAVNSLRHHLRMEGGVKARENSYFSYTLRKFGQHGEKNPFFIGEILVKCYQYTDLRYIKFISKIIFDHQQQKQRSSNLWFLLFKKFESLLIKLGSKEEGYLYYSDNRQVYFETHRFSWMREYGRFTATIWPCGDASEN